MGNETIPVEPQYLENLLQRVHDDPSMHIRDWTAQALQGGLELGTAIYRLEGQADCAGPAWAWSLILKAIRPDPKFTDPQSHHYWGREVQAYQSGWLSRLPGPVTAPRCYDVCQSPDGAIWIWMEDIHEEGEKNWSIEQYRQVARWLGQFNGACRTGHPLLAESWVCRDWLAKYVEHAAPMVSFILRNPTHPAVQGLFPGATLPLSLAFWDERFRILKVLDRLPHTFCHQDAFRRNLFYRETGLVAIDWSYTGGAPIGAELAPLIGAAFGLAGFPASQAKSLDQTCFEGYLQGLAEAGWKLDPRQVRTGYTLTVLLRYILGAVVGELLPGLLDEVVRKHWADGIGKPVEEAGETDPGIAMYYQSIAIEALKLLGLGSILRVLGRTVSYSIRLGRARRPASPSK